MRATVSQRRLSRLCDLSENCANISLIPWLRTVSSLCWSSTRCHSIVTSSCSSLIYSCLGIWHPNSICLTLVRASQEHRLINAPSPCSRELSRCWNDPSKRITSSPFPTLGPSLQEVIHGGLHCLRIGSSFVYLYLHLESGLAANLLR